MSPKLHNAAMTKFEYFFVKSKDQFSNTQDSAYSTIWLILVEHQLCDQEVVGLIPSRFIPKIVLVAPSLGTQH